MPIVNKASFRFGFVFFVCLISCITENNAQTQSPERNWGKWGVRLGLNTISIMNYEVYHANEILTNSSYTNKNGYLLTGFVRFNINRIFLQPEIAWNEYRRTCSFSFPIESGTDYHPSTGLDINSKAVNTDFLVGYNIIHDYPFLFGIFVGSSFIGTYRTDYSMELEKSSSKTEWLLNYSGILGFSINISRIYFDLRYEISLPNANLNLNEIPDSPENYQGVKIKKREAILSLSFGVMF